VEAELAYPPQGGCFSMQMQREQLSMMAEREQALGPVRHYHYFFLDEVAEVEDDYLAAQWKA
jgi:hypothetical protein